MTTLTEASVEQTAPKALPSPCCALSTKLLI